MVTRNAFIASFLLMLAACSDQPEWKGWVYPNANFLTDSIPIGNFASLEECRSSASALLTRLAERRDEEGATIEGDYECGYQCKRSEASSVSVCERTER